MKIFVGGLLYEWKTEMIKEQFEKYGTISSIELIPDRKPGFNKGFGYVEMPNEEEANKAISELNGIELNGKKITVSIATERKK